ncbi:MAG: UDP-4-amino-4,6-dideoxy-N-acetyl-beta-L-altrosamine transaminase [Vampirovibrionales bacterium]|nr:UDP-4-amino-4,6-dideoxy-N-acetyl-beta-L-altrosamine transaminase [Vampirovibrionales bacterium]
MHDSTLAEAVYIPYGRQQITPDDIAAVTAVLQGDWLTQGPAIARFEQAVAQQVGAQYAVAVSNATAALHLACLSLDIGTNRNTPTKETVWTSPNTFVASANCARYCGATVDFVDIDPVTFNLSVDALREKLAVAALTGKLPKALIPVHFAGQPCAMDEIAALCAPYGIQIIEDAAHAIGAQYKNTAVGACELSQMTVFSFHPVKIITTAEGGMVTTNNPDLYERLLRLRSHGITRDPRFLTRPDTDPLVGPWYYEQLELGFNTRMTDLQAALGVSQLARLEQFVAQRSALAERYNGLLADLVDAGDVVLPAQDARTQSAWHLYVIQVPAQLRRRVFEALRAANIGVNVHYMPVHLQPDYLKLGFAQGDFPNAEAYYSRAISLPLYPDLTPAMQDRVVAVLRAALVEAKQGV